MGLGLTNSQTNDAKILYLSDNSTWGSDGVPALGTVTSASLIISYKTPDLDDYTADLVIDITQVFTDAAGDETLLVFPLTFGSQPELNTSPIGVNSFPDGIWKITYEVSDGTTVSKLVELLLDMQIKTKIYSDLATIDVKYTCANNHYTKPIDDVLLSWVQYLGMGANAYIAKKEEVLNILETLQRRIG